MSELWRRETILRHMSDSTAVIAEDSEGSNNLNVLELFPDLAAQEIGQETGRIARASTASLWPGCNDWF